MYFPGRDRLIPNLSNFVPNLRQTIVLPGCGHRTPQEGPAEVSAAMIEFLRG
jgi:pimeloyl-ACP methyl ester carboxylesterase